MKAIRAIWKNGRIVPSQPVDWPDGTTLTVEPIEGPRTGESEGNILGDDPASIARWLAWYDTLEPLIFTAKEEAALQAARRESRDWEKSRFDERAEQLKGMFEWRYLLETNAMGDFINRRRGVDERAKETRKEGAKLGTCIPVLGELFFGVEYSQSRDRNLERLKRALGGLACWPYTREAAEEYGRLAAQLKRAGRTIQRVDLQLAAIALTLGQYTVVSDDSDLAAVPGLSVETWVLRETD